MVEKGHGPQLHPVFRVPKLPCSASLRIRQRLIGKLGITRYVSLTQEPSTYDHTHWKTRDPVRSPIDKPVRARLVVGSVTTSESLVLYVSFFFLFLLFYNQSRLEVRRLLGWERSRN